MLSWLQTFSERSRSLISQANIDGHSRLNWAIFPTTSLVATRGLLPPIARGRMDPVSQQRPRILDTQPLETCRMRLMSHGRAPLWASSTIRCRVESGSGRPFTNTPPSWFTPLCPARKISTKVEVNEQVQQILKLLILYTTLNVRNKTQHLAKNFTLYSKKL